MREYQLFRADSPPWPSAEDMPNSVGIGTQPEIYPQHLKLSTAGGNLYKSHFTINRGCTLSFKRHI